MPIVGTSTAFSTKPFGGLGDDPPIGFLYNEVIATSVNNYVLRAKLINAGWDTIVPVDARITIAQNVLIGSIFNNIASFLSGTLPTNSRLLIENNGYILGYGGAGGAGSIGVGSNAGGNGGDAINLRVNTVIQNAGTIGGGGGGGGSGGAAGSIVGGSGGGGGAGIVAGAGGTGSAGSSINGLAGSTGNQLTGGAGGISQGVGAPVIYQISTAGITSFTVPDGVFQISVRACGGGGGGAGGMLAGCGGANHAGGGGGGGGALFSGIISVTPASTLTLTVGNGGAGGLARDNRNTFSGDGPTVGAEGEATTIFGPNVTILLGGGLGGQIQEGNGNCGTNTTAGGAGGTGSVSGSNVLAGYTLLSGGAGGAGGSNGATGNDGASLTGQGSGGAGGVGSGGAQPGAGGGGGGASLGNGGRGGRYQTGTAIGTLGPAPGSTGGGGGGGGGEGSGYGTIDGYGGGGYIELSYRVQMSSPVVSDVMVVGAGGGGSGTNGAGDIWGGGAGGSGGSVQITNQTLDAFSSYVVTVGTGGTAGRVTFNGSVLCNETSTQGGAGGSSSLIGGLVNIAATGGVAGTPAPDGDNGPGSGGAGGSPNGVAGGQQNPIQRNSFSAAIGGNNGSGYGAGGNGNGQTPFACPTAGGNGVVIVSYTASSPQFRGGTVVQNGTTYTHTFTSSDNLIGLGGTFNGFGGRGGDVGQNGQDGGDSSLFPNGGTGGTAGFAIVTNGFTVNLNGNAVLGRIV